MTDFALTLTESPILETVFREKLFDIFLLFQISDLQCGIPMSYCKNWT
jgi:hypothetical protein